jgi:hypothetical protein
VRLLPVALLLAAAATPAASQDLACPYNANMRLETRSRGNTYTDLVKA